MNDLPGVCIFRVRFLTDVQKVGFWNPTSCRQNLSEIIETQKPLLLITNPYIISYEPLIKNLLETRKAL